VTKPLEWIGGFSYELYLIHEVIGVSILQWLRLDTGLRGSALAVLPFVLVTPMAWQIYTLWSRPAMRFARRRLGVRAAGGE